MKKLIALLALICSLNSEGAPIYSTIYYALTNFNTSATTNTLRITPVSTPISDGTYFTTGLPALVRTTNGFGTNFLFGGVYQLEVLGVPYPNPILFAVPSNDASTYSAAFLKISGANSYNYTPPSATVAAGNNITLSTNGGVVTINSTGGGGSVVPGTSTTVTTNGATFAVNIPAGTFDAAGAATAVANATIANAAGIGTNTLLDFPVMVQSTLYPSNIAVGVGTLTGTNGGHVFSITGGTFSGWRSGWNISITNAQYMVVEVLDSTHVTVQQNIGYSPPFKGYTNAPFTFYPDAQIHLDIDGVTAGWVGNDGTVGIVGQLGATTANSGSLVFANGLNSWGVSAASGILGANKSLVFGSLSNFIVLTLSANAANNSLILRDDSSFDVEGGLTNANGGVLRLLGNVSMGQGFKAAGASTNLGAMTVQGAFKPEAAGPSAVMVTDSGTNLVAATLVNLSLVGTTLTAIGGSGSPATFDATQFGGPAGGTNIINGVPLTNAVNNADSETNYLSGATGGGSKRSGGLVKTWPTATGQGFIAHAQATATTNMFGIEDSGNAVVFGVKTNILSQTNIATLTGTRMGSDGIIQSYGIGSGFIGNGTGLTNALGSVYAPTVGPTFTSGVSVSGGLLIDSVQASGNVTTTSGQFIGNAGGVTNIAFPINGSESAQPIATAARYFSPNGNVGSTTEANASGPVGTHARYLTNFYIRFSLIGTSTNFTALWVTNGVDSNLSISLNGLNAAIAGNNTSVGVPVPAGQTYSLKIIGNNVSNGTPMATWYVEEVNVN